MKNLNGSIVAGIIRGEIEAMESGYKLFFGQVYAYAKSYVTDREQAKEIAQDCFVSLWEKRRELRPDTNLKPFLLHIARNKSLNFLKKQQAGRNYQDYIRRQEQSVNYHALKDQTAEPLMILELERLIAETLAGLPESCRLPYYMSRMEQMSYAAIAETLGVSIKTVEYRMMLVLKAFRIALRAYLPVILFQMILRTFLCMISSI